MESKIKIKLGEIEVEYEGSEEFLKQELPELIKTVSELYQTTSLSEKENSNNGKRLSSETGSSGIQMSTQNIAAKLSCSSGPDLVLAAATKLTLVDSKQTFKRNNLLEEMKTASAYFKRSYGSNLTNHLNGLIKNGKLNEPSTETYALNIDVKNSMEDLLANT